MTATEHDQATTPDHATRATQAIEIVCAGDLSRMEEFYHPDFVDHINEMTFHGYAGGRESVAFYKTIFANLRMGTEEQVSEGDRVASRWVLHGIYRRRAVTLRGITISRFAADGRIVEDRGHSDSIALVRQLGVARTLILGLEILTRRVRLPRGALG
jgi:predicted ester cyclase